jgi:glucokinase
MPRKLNSDHVSSRIAAAIRDFAPISRADLARMLNISPSTVTRNVDQLIINGIISEEGKNYEKQIGRPSTILRIEPNITSLIAVDLRLTEAYVAATNLNGNVLSSDTEILIVGDVQRSMDQLLNLLNRQADRVQAIAPLRAIVVGAPSIVNPTMGIVEWAPSLDWHNLPLREIITAEFDVPVRVENDVNLAALGEYWKGAAQRASNTVFVSVGTGIGAGIILDGRLHYGTTYAAGEVGYFITDIATLRDAAGSVGNLEKRVGREGTIRRAALVAQRYPGSKLAELFNQQSPNIKAQDIFDLAQKGDPAAQVVFNETVDFLTIVICNISVVLDPEIIVLGGPSDWKWDMLVNAIKRRIGSSLLRPVNLVPSELGRDAVILGAAYTAIQIDGVIPH